MLHPAEVQTPAQRELFCSLPGLSSLTPDLLARHAPDALWLLADDTGTIAARCSLWWRHTPPHQDHRLGLIGHYAVRDGAAADQVLRLACVQLARQGATLAVAPMDGNTWQRYRLLTERGSEPLFFLEPDNPDDWPAHFTAAGFAPLAQYFSSLIPDLAQDESHAEETARRLAAKGVTIRPVDSDHLEDELRRVYAVALASFRDNFLYTPIDLATFLSLYQGVGSFLRPELVLLAEQQGQVIGFHFGVPDLLQARRGQPVDTYIVKTLAVHPDHAGAGLGGLLTARGRQAAGRLGFRRAIHALMHEDSRSRLLRTGTAQTFRRYTLYARPLESLVP
jgi:GNAT superfamily N-acetyltransferase